MLFAWMLGCAPLANDYVLAAVRYAEAVEEELPAATRIERLDQISVAYPWFLVARYTLADLEMQRQNWTAAYTAFKKLSEQSLVPADRALVSERLASLQRQSPYLAAYARGEEAFAQNDYAAANKLALETVENKPNFELGWRLLGRVIMKTSECNIPALEKYSTMVPVGREQEQVRGLIERCVADLNRTGLIDPYADEPETKKRGKDKRK